MVNSQNPDAGTPCRWFAMCPNDAVRYVSAGPVGMIPTCERCEKIATGQR